jgi:hypothetical protein
MPRLSPRRSASDEEFPPEACAASPSSPTGAPTAEPAPVPAAAEAPPITPAAFSALQGGAFAALRALERGCCPLFLPGTSTPVLLPRSSPVLPLAAPGGGGWAAALLGARAAGAGGGGWEYLRVELRAPEHSVFWGRVCPPDAGLLREQLGFSPRRERPPGAGAPPPPPPPPESVLVLFDHDLTFRRLFFADPTQRTPMLGVPVPVALSSLEGARLRMAPLAEVPEGEAVGRRVALQVRGAWACVRVLAWSPALGLHLVAAEEAEGAPLAGAPFATPLAGRALLPLEPWGGERFCAGAGPLLGCLARVAAGGAVTWGVVSDHVAAERAGGGGGELPPEAPRWSPDDEVVLALQSGAVLAGPLRRFNLSWEPDEREVGGAAVAEGYGAGGGGAGSPAVAAAAAASTSARGGGGEDRHFPGSQKAAASPAPNLHPSRRAF